MIEYRQYVPEGSPPDLDEQVEQAVREAVSQQASALDDPGEFYDRVEITRRDSRRGGHWVHGQLDADPVADYLDEPVERERFEVAGAVPMIAGDSDLTADERRRLARKGQR